ncbi:MAG: protein kinase [Acidobacteria bacterium]|nr:protein kinase [Acidobacteriota bacterium]
MKNTQIGHWVVEDKLGEGGMGEVWLAHHSQISRKVAIKVMSQPLLADQKLQERFVQEASAQARLQHPNIVPVSDFFSANGVNYLVMPYIEGQSLEEKLESLAATNAGPMPIKEALKIAADVLPALDYAHQQLIIHRDVKPSNILLDRSGHAYLVDFGIALMIGQERKTKTGTAVGTSSYMSPDQIRSPKQIDHRTDVYSFGCVLYEMLTGKPPFEAGPEEGDTDFAVKYHHLHTAPKSPRELNPQIPEKIEALVMKALAKNPDERFVSCGAFARALADADETDKIIVKSIICPHCKHPNQQQDSPSTFCNKCGKPLAGIVSPAVAQGGGTGWKVATAILAIVTFISLVGYASASGDLSKKVSEYDSHIANQRQLAPVSITNIRLRNEEGGKILGDFTDSFSYSNLKFVDFYVTLQNNRIGIEGASGTMDVKYFGPSGELRRNAKTSPPNATFTVDFSIPQTTSTTEVTQGWGNKDGGAHVMGIHRIEFWWKGQKLGEKGFRVY